MLPIVIAAAAVLYAGKVYRDKKQDLKKAEALTSEYNIQEVGTLNGKPVVLTVRYKNDPEKVYRPGSVHGDTALISFSMETIFGLRSAVLSFDRSVETIDLINLIVPWFAKNHKKLTLKQVEFIAAAINQSKSAD